MYSILSLPRWLLNRLLHSRIVRNVAVVASGMAAAQAITMAFAPLITRIYGPEAFGKLGTFMALVAVAIPLAALAYPIAIVLPRDDREALGLVRLSIIVSFVVALLVALVLWVGGDWLALTLGTQSITSYMLLIPVVMLFAAWMQIAQQWLIRKRHFGVIARSALAHSLILNIGKSGIGWLSPSGTVLIALATLGHMLHAALLVQGARRGYTTEVHNVVEQSSASLKKVAHGYRDFPIYRAPQNVINAASQSLPVLMLSAFFGPIVAGFYTLANMVMGMPSTLLGKAVSDVFYPRITEAAHNGENLPRKILLATGILLVVGIVPFGLVVLFGHQLFILVFGEAWGMAGDYARWLAIFFLFNFINKPAVSAVPVLGIQRGLLVYELFSTAGKTLGLVAGFYWFGSSLWAVALFTVIGVIAYSAMMLWILFHAIQWSNNAKTGR